jgi:hypothetical protein
MVPLLGKSWLGGGHFEPRVEPIFACYQTSVREASTISVRAIAHSQALARTTEWSSDKKFRQTIVPKGNLFPILPVNRKMPPACDGKNGTRMNADLTDQRGFKSISFAFI